MLPLLALLALPAGLRISEAMVDPASVPDNHGEFVELHAAGEAVDLDGFRLILGGSDTIRLPGHRLEEGADWVVGHVFDPDNGGFAPDTVVASGWTLPNGGGRIDLVDPSGTTLDSLVWDRSTPGTSVERCPGGIWSPSTGVYGAGDRGTPGAPNSCDHTPLRVEGAVEDLRRDGDSIRIAVRNRGTEAWSGRRLEIGKGGVVDRVVPLSPGPGERVDLAVWIGEDTTGRVRWVARLERDGRPGDDSSGLWVVGSRGAVALSEIQPADPGPEWVEVAQELAVELDLSGWTVGDQEPRGRIPSGTALPSAGRLVLSPDCPLLRAQTGVSALACASPSPWPRLSVVEDRVVLRDADGRVRDSVSWSREGGAWPKGRTRERQDLSSLGSVDSWLPSANEGGTPGYGPQPAEGWTDAGGDGRSFRIQERRMRIGDAPHRLRMEIRSPSDETLRIDLHDMGRRRVLRLHDGPPPRNGVLLWDGRDAEGHDTKPGVYVATAEFLSGRKVAWRAREWIVVAPR